MNASSYMLRRRGRKERGGLGRGRLDVGAWPCFFFPSSRDNAPGLLHGTHVFPTSRSLPHDTAWAARSRTARGNADYITEDLTAHGGLALGTIWGVTARVSRRHGTA